MKRIILILLAALALSPSIHAQRKSMEPTTYNYKRGVEAYNNNKLDEAANYFSKELADNPKNGYAAYYLACTHFQADATKLDVVLSGLNQALKLLPKKEFEFRSQAYCVRASVQTALGDTLKALDDLALGIKTDPTSSNALNTRAQLYIELDKYDLAEADYKASAKYDESNTESYTGLGYIAMLRDDWTQAVKWLDRSLALDGTSGRALSLRCVSYQNLNKYREATADAISLLSLSNEPNAMGGGLLRAIADKAFVFVDTQLRAKALQDKGNPIWPFTLGYVCQNTGHYQQAVKLYRELIETSPEEYQAVYSNLASCYASLYDYPEALKCINLSIANDSTDVSDRIQRALIYYSLNDRTASLADADYAVKMAPDEAGVYAVRGSLRAHYGDKQAALDDYNTAIALDNSEVSNYMYRGRLYAELGDNQAAKRDFDKTIQLDTVPSQATSALFAYAALGDTAHAIALNDSIMADKPAYEQAGNLYNAACVYAIMKRTDRALDYLKQAFEHGYRDLVHMGYDSDMDNLRQLPRYKELVAHYTDIYHKELNHEAVADSTTATNVVRLTAEVPFTRESGIYKVKCTINGLPLHFYFDTGAADVTISSVEAAFMLKNGYLKTSDIGGRQYYGNASGEISEGTTITLATVEIGGLTLRNVKASVVHNQKAPLLLGQSVLSRLGQIEIDYAKNLIKITYAKAQ